MYTVTAMSAPTPFPSCEELLSAVRGHRISAHPLTGLAREFGRMHRRQLHLDEPADRRHRNALTRRVDEWVANHLPPPHPASTLHPESMGTVIDRLAEAQVLAFHLLMTIEPSHPSVHKAWYRLAELRDNYTDLTTAVTHRALRLPCTSIP